MINNLRMGMAGSAKCGKGEGILRQARGFDDLGKGRIRLVIASGGSKRKPKILEQPETFCRALREENFGKKILLSR